MSKFIVIGWDSENGDGKDYIGPFDTYGEDRKSTRLNSSH